MKKNNRHPNWILHLAGILFCLTLFSMHLTSGLYARYSATSSSDDGARVARFNIEQTGTLTQLIELDVYPGFTYSYTLVLENNSEVAVAYTVTVERLTENLPLTVSLNDYTGTMDANTAEEKTCTLSIAWDVRDNSATYSQDIDAIRVMVRAEQID